MKKIIIVRGLAVLLCLASIPYNCQSQKIDRKITYRGIYPDDQGGENGLYNPERGFRLEIAVDVEQGKDVWNPSDYPNITSKLESESLKYASDSVTLVQTYFYLSGFLGRSLPETAFSNMGKYFERLRELNKKAVLRFAYEKDFLGRVASGPTLADVLTHMEQLKPFIEKNKDVIQVVQAGFIGAWGEWHGSFYGLERSEETRRTILEKILWMTPVDRMVQIRVPIHKNLIMKGNKEYNRVSFHDDFIIIQPHQWDGEMHEGTANFKQIVMESPYLIVDGELPWGRWSINKDNDNPEKGWIVDGLQVARRLFLQHYTTLSIIHNYKEDNVTDKYSMMYWKETPLTEDFLKTNQMPVSNGYFSYRDGTRANRNVFEYIRDHLGYRLELQQLKLTAKRRAGIEVAVDISLINRGFSTPHNAHPIYLTLTDEIGNVIKIPTPVNANGFQPRDPSGKSLTPLIHRIQRTIRLPRNYRVGKYQLGLWIPDGSNRLKYSHKYAIRCANGDVKWWVSPDGKYGINQLTTL